MVTTETGTGTSLTGSIRGRLANIRRVQVGQTEAWLAREVGVSQGHLKRVLDGERPMAPDLAARIEQVLSREEAS